MMKELLPVGTVVNLKGRKDLLVIIGYLTNKEDDKNKIYDYVASEFPLGYKSDYVTLFDMEDIKEVMFIGYQNNTTDEVLPKLTKYRNALKEGKSIEEAIKSMDNK